MMSTAFKGVGFMPTNSRAESHFRIKELISMGFIINVGTVLDDGFLFFYTDKGEKFARLIASESKEVGMSPDDYVDIFVALRKKGDLDEPQQMGDGKQTV